jgi:hypothetical protein
LQKVGVDKFLQFGKPVRDIKTFRKGQMVDVDTLSRLMGMSLREQVEVAFSLPRQMYQHFGFDFLVYIGLAKPTPLANSFASERGLFLEEIPSPYRRRAARR